MSVEKEHARMEATIMRLPHMDIVMISDNSMKEEGEKQEVILRRSTRKKKQHTANHEKEKHKRIDQLACPAQGATTFCTSEEKEARRG